MKSVKGYYNVKSIICIFDMCFEEHPCKHNVKFYNKSGDVLIVKLSIQDIYKLCIELKYPIPPHIETEHIKFSKNYFLNFW